MRWAGFAVGAATLLVTYYIAAVHPAPALVARVSGDFPMPCDRDGRREW